MAINFDRLLYISMGIETTEINFLEECFGSFGIISRGSHKRTSLASLAKLLFFKTS
jgi:hypothetical protein